MKRFLLIPALLLITLFISAQCDEVFISEYIEGRYNNKAMELYNPTDQPINLKDYRLVRWSNGSFIYDPQYKVDISGIIPPKDVYVLVVDKRDPQGFGQEEPVDDALQAKADTFLCPVYNQNSTFYHNGDDAYTLEKMISGTWTVIDVFAEVGVDPGNAWTDNPNASPPFTDGPGGNWWTRDRVLIRDADVQQGLTTMLTSTSGAAVEHPDLPDAPSPFDPRVQWDTLPRYVIYDTVTSPYVDSLGSHACLCNNTSSIRESYNPVSVKVYPNPATGRELYFNADVLITNITVRDLIGNTIQEIEFKTLSRSQMINIADLSQGIYLVEIYADKRSKTVEKIIVP